jgi:hypothetical protein
MDALYRRYLDAQALLAWLRGTEHDLRHVALHVTDTLSALSEYFDDQHEALPHLQAADLALEHATAIVGRQVQQAETACLAAMLAASNAAPTTER